jgi:hypothetical protein
MVVELTFVRGNSPALIAALDQRPPILAIAISPTPIVAMGSSIPTIIGAACFFEKWIDPNHQTAKRGEIGQRKPPPQ